VLAGTGPGIAWSLAAVLVLEVAALWGIGAALAVLAQESDGVPVRWREVWLWPVRHPRAALVLAGVGVLVQVAVVAAVLLLALLLAWVGVDASVGWSPVMLVAAGLAVLTALGPVIRGAGRRLLVGDERHPGMLRSAPAWGQDRPLRGYLAFGGLLAVGATVGWQRLTEARGWPEWLDDPVRALLGAAFVLLVAVVVVDDCSHGLPVPGASRTPARGLLRWAGGAAVVVVPALLLIVVTQVNPWGAVRVEQSRVPWSPGPLVTGVADGDLLLDGQATRPDYVGLCRGLDCVQALGSTKNAGLALGTDDGLLWEARWTVDGRAIDESGELLGEGWQDLPAVLTLRSVDVDAFWSDAWAAGADQQQISLDERPALAEVELARSTWGAMSPNGDPAGAIVDLPVALDARDGTLALATSFGPAWANHGTGPVYLARCTGTDCEVVQTEVSRSVVPSALPLDVALGPDGTLYATVYGVGSTDQRDIGALWLLVLPPDGEVVAHELVSSDGLEVDLEALPGADVEVGEDGTVWVLDRRSTREGATLLRCEDATCSSWERAASFDRMQQSSGVLAVDGSDRPMVVWADPDRLVVDLLSCTDTACSATESRLLAADVGDSILGIQMMLGLSLDDGLPVVTVYDESRLDPTYLRQIRCLDARCGAD
jgi:hypothetical protein